MSSARKGGLGKGLEALFVDNDTSDITPSLLKITEVEPNAKQPRKDFEDKALSELADSIREHGVLQPLLVRPMSNGRYQIVAGERRWRASRMAGLSELPVIVMEMSDGEAMELALIENLQREDLNPLEEAMGYQTLIENFSMTQEQVAKRVGKSRPAVANALRLLGLPPEVESYVRKGEISAGHARALLTLEDAKQMEELAKRIVKEGLSVREVEKLGKKPAVQKPAGKATKLPAREQAWGDSFYQEMEIALAEELGRKIKITAQQDKGTLEIAFYSREELTDLARRLVEL